MKMTKYWNENNLTFLSERSTSNRNVHYVLVTQHSFIHWTNNYTCILCQHHSNPPTSGCQRFMEILIFKVMLIWWWGQLTSSRWASQARHCIKHHACIISRNTAVWGRGFRYFHFSQETETQSTYIPGSLT